MSFLIRKDILFIREESRLTDERIKNTIFNTKLSSIDNIHKSLEALENTLMVFFPWLDFRVRVNKQKEEDIKYLIFNDVNDSVIVYEGLILFKEDEFMVSRYWNKFLLSVYKSKEVIKEDVEPARYLAIGLVKHGNYFMFEELEECYRSQESIESYEYWKK